MKKYVHSFEEFVRLNSKRKVNEDDNIESSAKQKDEVSSNNYESDINSILSDIKSNKTISKNITQSIISSSLNINDWMSIDINSKIKFITDISDFMLTLNKTRGASNTLDIQEFRTIKNDDDFIYLNYEYVGRGGHRFSSMESISKFPISYNGLKNIIKSDASKDLYGDVEIKYLPVYKNVKIKGINNNGMKNEGLVSLGYYKSIAPPYKGDIDSNESYVSRNYIESISVGNYKNVNYANDFINGNMESIDNQMMNGSDV